MIKNKMLVAATLNDYDRKMFGSDKKFWFPISSFFYTNFN